LTILLFRQNLFQVLSNVKNPYGFFTWKFLYAKLHF